MAKTTEKATESTTATETEKKSVTSTEKITEDKTAKYSISDFVAHPSMFDTDKIVVKTALEQRGNTEYTISEAKEIVSKFKNKEVK